MWRIMGVDKITKRVVNVAVADNVVEKGIMLKQERRNYEFVWAVPIRWARGKYAVASV